MEASPIRRTGWNRSIRSAAVGTGMHTQHLSFFIAAAEELNVHRAAARLGVSEQALARNLRSLELELDVALFRRLPRGLRLTEAGEALLAHARTIENHMHLVIEQARNHAQGRPERLEVGAYGAVLLTHIPAVLQTFRAIYPAVDIVLHNLPKDQMIKGLRQGRLHACFDRMVPTLPDLQRECVVRERIVVALNRKNPLAAKREVHFLDLRDEPMIVGDLPNSSRMPAYVLGRHYSFDIVVAQKVNNFISAVCLVAGGFGTCLVPESLMTLNHPAVVYRPLRADIEVAMDLYCLFRPGPQPRLLQDFLDVVHRHDVGRA